jgi:hypothetical protein
VLEDRVKAYVVYLGDKVEGAGVILVLALHGVRYGVGGCLRVLHSNKCFVGWSKE